MSRIITGRESTGYYPAVTSGRGWWLVRLLVIACSLAAALATAEIALRVLLPPSKYFYVWPPGTTRVLHPSADAIRGAGGPSHFTINSVGIRGSEFGQSGREYRILAVGGSTTECLYLDDTKAWPFRVQERLGKTSDGRDVWVGNVGRSGVNSRDHVLHVKYLLPQYPPIDAVLVLVGINDLTVRLSQGEQYSPPAPLSSPGASAAQIGRAFLIAPGKLQNTLAGLDEAPWYKRTAVYQVGNRVRVMATRAMGSQSLMQDAEGRAFESWRANRRAAATILDQLPDLTSALAEYAGNLHAMIDLARARGTRIVFMTQPTLWRADLEPHAEKLLWLGGVGNFQEERGKAYYSVRALAEAMALYNQELVRVCRSGGIECIDLADRVPKTVENFYDDAHFTEKGAQVVAKTVSEYFAKKKPFVPAEGRL